MILNALSLHALVRLRERWVKAKAKTAIYLEPLEQEGQESYLARMAVHIAKCHSVPNKNIAAIDAQIASRQGEPVRSSLPKKQQRKLGMREAV